MTTSRGQDSLDDFSHDQLERVLAKLPSQRHRLAFAAGISERLLPNYETFSRDVGWGDPALLRSALDLVWRMVGGGRAMLGEIRELQAQMRMVTPDTENHFASPLTSAALDAASAIHEALEVGYRDDARRVADIATFASDTVDLFVKARDDMDPNDPLLEVRIVADPLMARELKKQRQDVELLSQAQLDAEFVRRYRNEASYDGKSNLDIP